MDAGASQEPRSIDKRAWLRAAFRRSIGCTDEPLIGHAGCTRCPQDDKAKIREDCRSIASLNLLRSFDSRVRLPDFNTHTRSSTMRTIDYRTREPTRHCLGKRMH